MQRKAAEREGKSDLSLVSPSAPRCCTSRQNPPTPEQKEARQRFFRAYHESGFLFTKESGIEALLKKLNDDGMKVIGFKEHSDAYKSDPALMIEQFKETTNIQLRVFEEGLAKLRAAMHPYLDFSKVWRSSFLWPVDTLGGAPMPNSARTSTSVWTEVALRAVAVT